MSVTQLDTMVKSTMTETVPSSGRGGTAAAMAQNEQTTMYELRIKDRNY